MKRTGRQKDIVTPEKKQEQRELLRLFSANIRKILKNTDLLADDLQEIRLRTGAPLLVVAKDQEYFLTPDGALTGEWEKGYPVSPTDIRDTMDYIGSFSLYAYEDELRQGFLTVEGGHRIGKDRFREFCSHMGVSYRETLQDLVIFASDDGTRGAAEFMVHGTYLQTDPGLPEARGQTYVLPAGGFFEVRDGLISRITTFYNLNDWIAQVSR